MQQMMYLEDLVQKDFKTLHLLYLVLLPFHKADEDDRSLCHRLNYAIGGVCFENQINIKPLNIFIDMASKKLRRRMSGAHANEETWKEIREQLIPEDHSLKNISCLPDSFCSNPQVVFANGSCRN